MWPDVEEKVAIERANINQLLAAYQPLIHKSRRLTPDFFEVSALATMLHSFYNGIENIFERIALEIDDALPAGPASHSELLTAMSRSTAQRPRLLSAQLFAQLSAYLGYRHVFRHAYSFQLEWNKMQDLVWQCEETWQQLQTALDDFFEM